MTRLFIPMTFSLLLIMGILWSIFNYSDQILFATYFSFILLACSVSFIVLFWSYLLWLELAKIQSATEAFGAGNYATRISQCQYSPLITVVQAFNNMAEQTQNSINNQRELIAAISHELRTPIARMRFALDMLTSNSHEKDKHRYINNMNIDLDEINNMLSELLNYARLDQKNKDIIKLSQVNILAWFEESMSRLTLLGNTKELVWHTAVKKDKQVVFDPILMRRLLENLVHNAYRYAKTRIEVTLHAIDNRYMLLVDDDGVIIPMTERERLFEPFTVLDNSRNKDTTGFGLGLAIVKRVIDAHEGTVVIQDSPLGGTRLMVTW